MDNSQQILQLEMLQKVSLMLKQTFMALNQICQEEIKNNVYQVQHSKYNNHPSKSIQKHKNSQRQQNSFDNQNSGSQQESRKKSGTSKKKKVAKWELEGKPRPPLNAFMLFLRDSKFQIQQARPQLTSSEVSTYASTIWNDLPEQQKQKYREEYRENRKLYDLEMQEHIRKTGYDPKSRKQKKKNKNKKEKHNPSKQVVEIEDSDNSDQENSMMI